MIIRQINTFKDGQFDYSFLTVQQFENYAFNHIFSDEVAEHIKEFKDVTDRIVINNGLPKEMEWVRYLASYARDFGYKVSIVLEL